MRLEYYISHFVCLNLMSILLCLKFYVPNLECMCLKFSVYIYIYLKSQVLSKKILKIFYKLKSMEGKEGSYETQCFDAPRVRIEYIYIYIRKTKAWVDTVKRGHHHHHRAPSSRVPFPLYIYIYTYIHPFASLFLFFSFLLSFFFNAQSHLHGHTAQLCLVNEALLIRIRTLMNTNGRKSERMGEKEYIYICGMRRRMRMKG